jgi:hypothetical protein
MSGALQIPMRKTKCNVRLVYQPECLVCQSGILHIEREGGRFRRMGWHCARCHSKTHNSCIVCNACLPDRARSDRVTCSSKCRQQAHRWRHWRETKIKFSRGGLLTCATEREGFMDFTVDFTKWSTPSLLKFQLYAGDCLPEIADPDGECFDDAAGQSLGDLWNAILDELKRRDDWPLAKKFLVHALDEELWQVVRRIDDAFEAEINGRKERRDGPNG